MIKNKENLQVAKLLLENKKYNELRSWFYYWDNEDEMIDKCVIWGRIFMANYLRDESPEFHRDLIKAFFSKNNEYIAAPRGYAKTTIIQLCASFSIATRQDNFIVLIEKTFTEAAEVLSGIRFIFNDNPITKQIYGDPQITIEEKVKDAQGDMFIFGVRLRGKGFNAPIRGLKSKEWRPSRIILDDVESDEHIGNEEQRLKYLDNFNRGVQPAIDVDGSIKMFGTILHFDSLLNNLIKWHKGKIYKAYNPQTEQDLLWPERWSWAKLMKKKEEMTAEKGSNAFNQEFLNDPISDDTRIFKQNWLWRKDRQITWDRIKDKMMNGYAAIDTADSVKETADYIGVIVHFIDREGNQYRVSCRRERRNILSLIDLIFEIWKTWQSWGLIEIGVEKKAFEDQIKPLLDIESQKRNVYPIVTELKPMKNSKRNRIQGNLEGRYELGRIWTIIDENGKMIENTEELLNELYEFPFGKRDDLADAEAYVCDMVTIPMESGIAGAVKRQHSKENPFY